jgi:acyl-CoA dehydrogenase
MTERGFGGVRFGWTELTPEELSLQAEVRAFLAAELAVWLLATSGLRAARVPTTVASDPDLVWSAETVSGAAGHVAWGRAAEHAVVLAPTTEDNAAADGLVVAVFAVADLRVEPHVNLAGEPRDTVYFAGAAPLGSAPVGPDGTSHPDQQRGTIHGRRLDKLPVAMVSAETLRGRGALTRVVLMAGAAGRIRDITVRYTGERYQFGKPIGRFPGIQRHVVHVAQQAAMLEMAAALVCAGVAADPGLTGQAATFQVAAAKSIAADAATIATAAAHQAHGAMGMNQEYPLHHLTRCLWAWTREYGTGAQSADEVGALVASVGADALWPAIASGGTTLTRA